MKDSLTAGIEESKQTYNTLTHTFSTISSITIPMEGFHFGPDRQFVIADYPWIPLLRQLCLWAEIIYFAFASTKALTYHS